MKIETIVKVLKQGKVVVCPTDTVYGLVCDAANKKAVEKVFKIKKRPKSKPLPVFVKDLKMAKDLAEINEEQEKFLKKFWPGPVTAVLKRKAKNPPDGRQGIKRKIYGVDKKTIALRIPNHRLVLDLVKHINTPLACTSANISGKPSSGNIQTILKQFEGLNDRPDFVIDIGNLAKAKPSKIVDLTADPPKVLRY